MTTSIGHRWKGSNVRSRVVLIARWLAQTPSPPCAGAQQTFLLTTVRVPCLILVRPKRPPCPIIMSTILGIATSLRYKDFRWPWRRGPPLTIPNREVKPVCADGTATPSGRVGRRLFLKSLHRKMRGLFFCARSKNGTPKEGSVIRIHCYVLAK